MDYFCDRDEDSDTESLDPPDYPEEDEESKETDTGESFVEAQQKLKEADFELVNIVDEDTSQELEKATAFRYVAFL